MNENAAKSWNWVWPDVGATPIHQGLDSEMFDRTDYPYSETFVREAIQNSLDARLDSSRPVIVRFGFHEEASGQGRPFLEQLIEHRRKAGLEIPPEWNNGVLQWLVVEDFNTKGLAGDLASRTSDFWNYWLNFGLSNKDGSGRGGRGIGRVTFLIASRLHCVIGYTRRSVDGVTAACGMGVLRAMEDENELKSTHAYLAKHEEGNIFALHDSPDFLDGLQHAFKFGGYNGEYSSGLALAVPYPYQELKAENILAAAIENFAPAILGGALELHVDGHILDASTIDGIAIQMAGYMNDEAIRADVGRYLELVRKAGSKQPDVSILLPKAQKNDFGRIRETEEVRKLQKCIADGEDLVLKLDFPLFFNGKIENVSLMAAIGPSTNGRKPIDRLFREGMSLPDVRSRNPGELDLVMIVEKGILAKYLNFCEGKAHLDLLESKEVLQKLAENGFDGPRIKRLVKRFPDELRLLLTPDVTAPDAQVFDAFFPKPSDRPGKKKKPNRPNDPPEPPPPPKPPVFRIETLDDGLRIRANPEFPDWPVNLLLTLAYADGSRRPSWSPYDFRLEDLSVKHDDCKVDCTGNKLRATDCGPRTEIEITGFDTNRELETIIRPYRNA